MKKEWILIPVACFSLVLCGWAEAQGATRMAAPGMGARIDMGKRAVSSRSSVRIAPGRGSVAARRPHSTGIGGPNRGRGNTGGTAQGGPGRDYNGLNNAPLGALLEGYLGQGYRGHGFNPYHYEDEYADAYRDAAIANAIVNMVGILVTASQPQQAYAVSAAPAPVAPRGHVERQRVLVQEGRTEEYQVWVPEYTIPETGEVVVGHNEIRRREIAPVYEEREIWVPTP